MRSVRWRTVAQLDSINRPGHGQRRGLLEPKHFSTSADKRHHAISAVASNRRVLDAAPSPFVGGRTNRTTHNPSIISIERTAAIGCGPSPILAVTSAVIAPIRRVDASRIVAVSNARPETSDATAGAISSLWHLGRVRTPSFRTLKVGSRTEDRRRRQSSPHAVGNAPRRPIQGRSTRAPTLPFLAVVASGRLSLPPSQRSSPSES